MKNIQLALVLFFLSLNMAFAQTNKESGEVTILTTAHCQSCEGKIGEAIKFEKGVKSYEFSEDSKLLTIRYKPEKTSEAKLKEIIGGLGYLPKEETAKKKCAPGSACCSGKSKSCSKDAKTER